MEPRSTGMRPREICLEADTVLLGGSNHQRPCSDTAMLLGRWVLPVLTDVEWSERRWGI